MKTNTKKAGAALGIVLIVLVVFSALGVGLMRLMGSNAIETSHSVSRAQSFWAAEAGLHEAIAVANKNRLPFDQLGMFGDDAHSGSTSHGSFAVSVEDHPDFINLGNRVKRYLVTSTGTSRGGVVRAVSITAEIETFASYMHASNYEETEGGGNIWFGPSDVLDGQVYCNDQINISGSARILKLARTGADSVNYSGGGTIATFEGGLELEAPPLDFGQFSADHVGEIESKATAGGRVLDEFVYDTEGRGFQITFLPSGQYRVQDWTGGVHNGDASTNYDVTFHLTNINGAIYVDGNAHVLGVVSGEVTVAAEGGIYIEDHIILESTTNVGPYDAFFDTNSVDDSVGLVAKERVEIQTDYSINIHAAILVTEGECLECGFGADQRYVNHGWPSINLWGSISQFRRGVVGTIGGQGFVKNYKYDTRFLDKPPPHFPYSSYNTLAWRE